jgi:hypothetical protein
MCREGSTCAVTVRFDERLSHLVAEIARIEVQ